MAWGGGGFKSCDALLALIENNDPKLRELVILPMKCFGGPEVHRLAKILARGSNNHLKSLSASGHVVPPDALEALGQTLSAGKSNLTQLSIGDNLMGDAGVSALCQGLGSGEALNLEMLDLSWKGIGAEGLGSIFRHLGSCESLQTLILGRNPHIRTLDFASLSSTRLFPNLRKLVLSECGLDSNAFDGWTKALSTNHPLELSVDSNPDLTAQSMASLANLSLKELRVSRCNVGDVGLKIISKHCSSNPGLEILDLSYNAIGPTGMEHFARALQEGTCAIKNLRELNLAGNVLNEESVQELASSFAELTSKDELSLAMLDMTDTSCGVGGAIDLIQLSILKNLVLFNNRLGSDGFIEIAKTLQGGHPNLETLDVGGNKASEAGVVALLQPLAFAADFQNTLRLLVVGGNGSGPSVETLVQGIKSVHLKLDIARDKPKGQGGDVASQFSAAALLQSE